MREGLIGSARCSITEGVSPGFGDDQQKGRLLIVTAISRATMQ